MTNLSMLKLCFTKRKHLKNNSDKNKNLTAGHPDTHVRKCDLGQK